MGLNCNCASAPASPYGERLFGICRVLQSAIDSNPL